MCHSGKVLFNSFSGISNLIGVFAILGIHKVDNYERNNMSRLGPAMFFYKKMQSGRDIVEYFIIFNTEFSYQSPLLGP